MQLRMNESLSYSLMLLSLGFGAVVAGISLSNTNNTISVVLVFIGGSSVLLGSAIEKFIYYPRAEYIKQRG